MGVQYANLTAEFVDGALYFYDSAHTTILVVSSTGFDLRGGSNTISTPTLVGGTTISTGILGGLTISTGILGGLTISSGLTLEGVATRTVTTAVTLAAADSGRIANCAVDGTFFTLPIASTTAIYGETFIIRNSGTTGAAQIILITATTNAIIGAGISTTNVLSNTKATADTGDSVAVQWTGSTSWRIMGMVGTWASTT